MTCSSTARCPARRRGFFAENFNDGYFDEQAMERKQAGRRPVFLETLHFVETADESKALNFLKGSKVILLFRHVRGRAHQAPSQAQPVSPGMRGGIPGFQGQGTLGAQHCRWRQARQDLWREIEVKADIYRLQGFFGPADPEGASDVAGGLCTKAAAVLITHGEEELAGVCGHPCTGAGTISFVRMGAMCLTSSPRRRFWRPESRREQKQHGQWRWDGEQMRHNKRDQSPQTSMRSWMSN